MAFSELREWRYGIAPSLYSVDELLKSTANMVVSKHLVHAKLEFIIGIIDKHLRIYKVSEKHYVNILKNLTSNSYLSEDSIRLIYKKLRKISNVLSFDVNEMMLNMCKNNSNTPYEIKELYIGKEFGKNKRYKLHKFKTYIKPQHFVTIHRLYNPYLKLLLSIWYK